MPRIISAVDAFDVRFPTSQQLDGSDAMHPDPDYSAAYCILRTDQDDGIEGHGFTFTCGRGNDLCTHAIELLGRMLVGASAEDLFASPGEFARRLTGDGQLRWLGPDKGVIHLAAAALINAVWDLYAKVEGKPLWQLLSELPPERLVECVDFRYLRDAITPEEALEMLRRQEPSRAARAATLRAEGYLAYTTSAGWLGYSDEKIAALVEEAKQEGWQALKMKVGRDPDDDLRRARMFRALLGDDRRLMMDANQVWGVDEAIARTQALAEVRPYWMEEPTSPDDVLGHARIAAEIAPIKVATGEHVQNAVMFKQLFQARAFDVCQIDACRVGGVNENIAILLMAAKFGVAVCPHAGGVGLCEAVQHLAYFDYVAVSGSKDDRMIEFADHLHEHFECPPTIDRGRYRVPTAPGYATMRAESIADYSFPDGPRWR
jgi:L-fuconate dehydratase